METANLSINASSDESQQYYTALAHPIVQAFLTYSLPVVVLLGLFGNSVAFILLKNSALRSTAHFYLCALTVCDSFTLISILASIWAGVLLNGHLHQLGWRVAWLQSGLRQVQLCRARLYLSFVCRTVSTWTVAAFSWERCLAVWRPMRFEGAAVGWRSGLLLLGLVAAAAGLNAYVIPGLQPDHQGFCRASQLFRVGRNVSMLMHSLAPWLLMLISNCLIACSLRRHQPAGRPNEDAVLLRNCQPHLQRHHRRRRGVTYRLVLVSFAFLVSTSLLTVCTVWLTIAEAIDRGGGGGGGPVQRDPVRDTVWLISFLPFTANFASTCPLYCLAGRKFRRAARLLVTCQLKRMRLARRLLDPSRPTSASTAAAAAAATATAIRPNSDPRQVTVSSRRQPAIQLGWSQIKGSPAGHQQSCSRTPLQQLQQEDQKQQVAMHADKDSQTAAEQVALMTAPRPKHWSVTDTQAYIDDQL